MAICSHRRGELRQGDSEGDDGGERLTQVVTDPIGNMLKKIPGDCHLLFHAIIDRSIVQGVGHLIGKTCLAEVVSDLETDDIIMSRQTLLRHHAMIGMKPQAVKIDVTIVYFHLFMIIHSDWHHNSCKSGILPDRPSSHDRRLGISVLLPPYRPRYISSRRAQHHFSMY